MHFVRLCVAVENKALWFLWANSTSLRRVYSIATVPSFLLWWAFLLTFFYLLFSYILQRAFSVLDGIGKTLNKKFDIGEIAAPYARNLLIEANPDALPPQVVTAQREWLKRADAQTRAVVNLFKAPDAIESIADIIRRIETGKLKIRVRALEVERAVERVAVTQDITLKALIASCMANIGCVLWVTNPGLYLIQAKIALGLATVMMLQAVKGQLTLSKMLKKEAKYSGAD